MVSGTVNHFSKVSLPSFNWTSTSWVPGPLGPPQDLNVNDMISTKPTALVLDLASQSAENLDVFQFSPPAPNCSYTLQVQRPYMQCETANSTLQPVFDYFINALVSTSNPIVTSSIWNNPNI
jgi:hypothetical protein